jgi:hypothetical protein
LEERFVAFVGEREGLFSRSREERAAEGEAGGRFSGEERGDFGELSFAESRRCFFEDLLRSLFRTISGTGKAAAKLAR